MEYAPAPSTTLGPPGRRFVHLSRWMTHPSNEGTTPGNCERLARRTQERLNSTQCPVCTTVSRDALTIYHENIQHTRASAKIIITIIYQTSLTAIINDYILMICRRLNMSTIAHNAPITINSAPKIHPHPTRHPSKNQPHAVRLTPDRRTFDLTDTPRNATLLCRKHTATRPSSAARKRTGTVPDMAQPRKREQAKRTHVQFPRSALMEHNSMQEQR